MFVVLVVAVVVAVVELPKENGLFEAVVAVVVLVEAPKLNGAAGVEVVFDEEERPNKLEVGFATFPPNPVDCVIPVLGLLLVVDAPKLNEVLNALPVAG